MTAIPPSILEPIEEGLGRQGGGEVIVRARDGVGHVYVFGGGIAWVTCDTVGWRLRDALQKDLGIESETLDAVVEECKARRTHFGETILAWGLTTREVLRDTLLEHTARNFSGILQLPGPLAAMFVPQKRTYSSDLLFTLEEIQARLARVALPAAGAPAPPVAPVVNVELERHLAELGPSLDGCEAIVVFDPAHKQALGAWSPPGQALDLPALLETAGLVDEGAPVARLVSSQSKLLRHSPALPHEVVSASSDLIHVVSRSLVRPGLGLVFSTRPTGGVGKALSASRQLLGQLEHLLALH